MWHFGGDQSLTQWGAVSHFAYAYRVRDDYGLLVFVWLRKEIQAALRHIDDHPLTQSRRQTVPPRQTNAGALPRQPHVDVGIGPGDFLVAQPVAPGDVGKRLIVMRRDQGIESDDGRTVRRQRLRRAPSQPGLGGGRGSINETYWYGGRNRARDAIGRCVSQRLGAL